MHWTPIKNPLFWVQINVRCHARSTRPASERFYVQPSSDIGSSPWEFLTGINILWIMRQYAATAGKRYRQTAGKPRLPPLEINRKHVSWTFNSSDRRGKVSVPLSRHAIPAALDILNANQVQDGGVCVAGGGGERQQEAGPLPQAARHLASHVPLRRGTEHARAPAGAYPVSTSLNDYCYFLSLNVDFLIDVRPKPAVWIPDSLFVSCKAYLYWIPVLLSFFQYPSRILLLIYGKNVSGAIRKILNF